MALMLLVDIAVQIDLKVEFWLGQPIPTDLIYQSRF